MIAAPADKEAFDALKEAIIKSRLSQTRRSLMSPAEKSRVLDQHLWQRFRQASLRVIPWVERVYDLRGKRALDVGCGTGSSTVAFALKCDHVVGIDIDRGSLTLAQIRAKAFGAENVTFQQVSPGSFTTSLPYSPYDLVLLYAVLEHQTIEERISTIQESWRCLKPGGIMVVCESPNRLAWFDYHTTDLPFYHNLPDNIRLKCYETSAREMFKTAVRNSHKTSDQAALITLARLGTGVSFHEFDLALQCSVSSLVIADGLEKEIVTLYPIRLEDRLLLQYFSEKPIQQSLAFARQPLTFIIRKPDGTSQSNKPVHSRDHIEWLRSEFSLSESVASAMEGLTSRSM